MNNSRKILCGGMLTIAAVNANAAIISTDPGSSPYSATLDTGAYNWRTGTDASLTSNNQVMTYSGSRSPVTTIDIVETPAEIGVDGLIEVYQVTTRTSYDYDQQQQSLFIRYSDDINGTLTTPESIQLSGEIMTDSSLISKRSEIEMRAGFNVTFDNPYTQNSVSGSLIFSLGNNPDNWDYSYTTLFDSVTDSMSDSWDQFVDFDQPVYYSMIYDLTGADGTGFQIDSLFLNVANYQSQTLQVYNEQSEEFRNLLSSTVIPALAPPPVPVPASAWLLGSGLLGLAGIARRRSS